MIDEKDSLNLIIKNSMETLIRINPFDGWY